MKLNEFQRKELTKFWFNLATFTFGSMILKLFEPSAPKFTGGSIGIVILGLIFMIIFVILGLEFSKGVKK